MLREEYKGQSMEWGGSRVQKQKLQDCPLWRKSGGREKLFNAGKIVQHLSADRKSHWRPFTKANSMSSFSLRRAIHLRSQDESTFLSHLNYQDIETFAPRDHNEIISYFANHQWPTGLWGDRSRLRTPETLILPFRIDHEAPGMETHSLDTIPDFAAEPTAEKEEDDRDYVPETPVHPDHTHRRAPLKLDELRTEG
jgi:hypothetical protein